jgi:hypothetical protein
MGCPSLQPLYFLSVAARSRARSTQGKPLNELLLVHFSASFLRGAFPPMNSRGLSSNNGLSFSTCTGFLVCPGNDSTRRTLGGNRPSNLSGSCGSLRSQASALVID